MKKSQNMNVRRAAAVLALVALVALAGNGATAQGRYIDVRLGSVLTPNNMSLSLYSDVQSPQVMPSMGLSIGWPVTDHSTLGVVYNQSFSSYNRPAFGESFLAYRLGCEGLNYKEILPDLTFVDGLSFNALLATNTVKMGTDAGAAVRPGMALGFNLGLCYKVGNTRIGLMYEWFGGCFFDDITDNILMAGLPEAKSKAYWGQSLMLSSTWLF